MRPTNPSTQQLIEGFHQSLRGNSTAERKKTFHTYLNSLKTSTNGDAQKLSAVVDGIIPQDFWERVLKVDIILHYKLFTQAFEILKSEHKVLVSKLVKSDWFIKKLLETYTAQQFVDELFCFTSVSSRTKIINRVIRCNKDAEFGKHLFEAYAEKYGLRAAKLLLPLCPLDVVEYVVINKNIKPSTSTIRKVIGKNLKLTKYFFNNKKCRNNDDVKYIARTNLPFFMELLREKQSETISGIGNSTTHKLITAYKSYIIENPKCLESDVLNLKRVHFDLKDVYEKLVFRLMVARGHTARFDNFTKILKPMPKQKQRRVFLNAFKTVAKCYLDDRPDLIDESFLQTCEFRCEDVDERVKYAMLAYKTDNQTHWIKYMRTKMAIALLKEKMLLTSKLHERDVFARMLVETCKINDDEAALLDVMKYVTKRFRNKEASRVIKCFCTALLQHFKLYELSKEHWKYINELQKLLEVNNVYFSQDSYIIQEQIISYLKNDEPIHHLLTKLCEKSFLIEYNYRPDVGVAKEFILKSVEYFNARTEDDDNEKLSSYLRLLQAMQTYNLQNKFDSIDIKETLPIKWMVQRLENGFKQHQMLCIDSLFAYCIFGDVEPEEQNTAIRVLFKKQRQNYNVLLHIVKHNPNVLIDNIDSFLESNAVVQIFEDQRLLKHYRRLSHLNLNQAALEYFKTNLCKESVKSEYKYKITQDKIKSLKALAVCMNEEGYLKLIKQYHPDNAHLTNELDTSTELYQYREAICKTISSLNTPSKALEALLPFCVGGYLKFCLKGLYHFTYHTQERNISHIIYGLKTKAVSVRKHAAFLSLATLGRKHILEFFEHYTPQNIFAILKSVFKNFTKNLDKILFEIFKVLLKKANKNDKRTIDFITQEIVIPENFVADYVEFVWNAIELFGKQGSDFEHTKFKLLNLLKESDYYLLDDKFLDRIVKENFLKENKYVYLPLITEVVLYLICCNSTDKQNCRLQLVFEMLRNCKITDKGKALRYSTYLIEQFALLEKGPPVELIMRFKEHFKAFTDVAESFNKHLELDLLELHIKSLSSTNYATSLSEKIAYFLNDFEKNYGIGLVMYSKQNIVDFIKFRLKKLELFEDNLYLFLHCLYATSDCLASAIIVTELLVKLDVDAVYDVQTRKRQENLIVKLKSRKELVVKVLLALYFRNRRPLQEDFDE